ncbi:MAG TPA: type III pantothenate kinase [Dehalococcoidia bacterium]|jgi:type III pantothenate kinase|nr:type III pantothenate kinase [Dehalococcoidia bacterium]
MLLAADIGNTQIKLGVFDDGRLTGRWHIATDTYRLADEYAVLVMNLLSFDGIDRATIDGGVYASTVPSLAPVFGEMFKRHFGVSALRVGVGVKTGMRIQYEPRELGPDRIAVALGALRLHAPPLIVVSLGTGTVFEAVSRDGAYMGGAIAPGISVATEALAGRAAMLSSVELAPPKKAIGTNTVAAMQSGVMFGYAELIEGMVRRFKDEIGEDAWVVGTGGWAPLMSQLTHCFDHIDDTVSLHGLHQLYKLNEGAA